MLADLEAHIAGRMSVTVGSCDDRQQPHFARGVGFRPGAGAAGTLLVPAILANEVVADFRANARIAVTITDMDTFVSRQVKGTVTRIGDADESDLAFAKHFVEQGRACLMGFAGESFAVGYSNLLSSTPVVAIEMQIEAIFDQTPRSGAGGQIA